MSYRTESRKAADLKVDDYVLLRDGEGWVTRIEDNPARGSTGRYLRVYWIDATMQRTRSVSMYPIEDVTVAVSDEDE